MRASVVTSMGDRDGGNSSAWEAGAAAAIHQDRLERVTRALEELTNEQRALRAEIDSLRRAVVRAHATSPATDALVASTQVEPATGGTSTESAVAPAIASMNDMMLARSGADAGVRPPSAAMTDEPTPQEMRAALGRAIGRIELVRSHPEALSESTLGYRLALPGTFAFESNSSTLSVPAREALRQAALVLMRSPGVTARVEGHADSWGDPEANRRISLARADAVRDELVRLGVEAIRVTSAGAGSMRPIADNRTAEGRAENRRVEIYFEVQS